MQNDTTTYLYDGDGNRVKKTANGVSTFYVGNYYEVTNGVATKYYYFGKQRVAMRTSAGVVYLHSDHLGSTSATSGASVSAQTYYAFGNIRSTTGTAPTDFGFTGQRRDVSAGLLFYNARYYDPTLGRFIQADTIVPQAGNPQSLNRYAYAYNNPLRYIDPTGHDAPDIINFLGEFVTGVANEWLYNTAWFVPTRNQLKVQYDESDAKMAGRVVGDMLSMAQGVIEVDAGLGMIGGGALGGAATCLETLGGGCAVGVAVIGAGATVIGHGATTAINGATGAGSNLGNLIARAEKTSHGWDRSQQGNRPTGPAWNDARQAGPSKVLYDNETGNYVVQGDKGRIHIFIMENMELKFHTSFTNPSRNTLDRILSGKWSNLTEAEYSQWLDLLNEALK